MECIRLQRFNSSSNQGRIVSLGSVVRNIQIMVTMRPRNYNPLTGPMELATVEVAEFDGEYWPVRLTGTGWEMTLPYGYEIKRWPAWMQEGEEMKEEKLGVDWSKVTTMQEFEKVDPQYLARLIKDIRNLSSSYTAIHYVLFGTPGGDFIKNLFSNDLVHTYSHADGENQRNLDVWVSWLYNVCPQDAWGSREKYMDWIKGGGLVGWMRKQREEDQDERS